LVSLSMPGDVIPLGPRVLCGICEKPMLPVAKGFQCKEPGCGEGFLRAERGIRVYREKNTLIFESGDVATNNEPDQEGA